jgi:hypothetical protein
MGSGSSCTSRPPKQTAGIGGALFPLLAAARYYQDARTGPQATHTDDLGDILPS